MTPQRKEAVYAAVHKAFSVLTNAEVARIVMDPYKEIRQS